MKQPTLCSTCQVTKGYQLEMNGQLLTCIHTQEHARELEDLIEHRQIDIFDKHGQFKYTKKIPRGNKFRLIEAQLGENNA